LPFVGTVRFDRCFFKGACRKTIIEMAGPPQTGNTIMTDERIDLAQADDEVPGTATPPDLEVSTPVNRSIQNGIVEVWFRIPLYGEHQVWMEFFVNGVPSGDISEKWFLGYQDGFQWQPFISQVPGAAHLKAKWRHGEYFSKYTEIDFWISNQPVITYPAENETITDRRPKIIGTGGGNCSLRVMRSHSADQLSTTFTASSNQWAIDLNQRLPYGDYSIAVEQSKSGYTSRHSLNRPFKIRGIDFSSPQPAQLVPAKDIVFMGESNPGVMVHVVRADNNYKALSERVEVPSNQHWRVGLREDLIGTLESGSLSVKAQWHNGWSHDYSDILTFKVLGVPAITGPAIEQDMSFDVTGNNYLPDSTVKIYIHLSTDGPVGSSAVTASGKTWSARVTLQPGPVSLVAEQSQAGVVSGKGVSRKFKIRPPQLTAVTATATSGNTVRFSGVGYNGARVEIAKTNGPGGHSLGPVTVVNNAWLVDATNWPPGLYSFSATQKVSDGDGGWIVSKPFPFTYEWKVPVPTEVTYTVANYTPTFSGRGYNGATVELYNPGGASNAAPDALVANGRWSSPASEVWGPTLKREVHLRQRLGKIFSDWFVLEVTIALLPPVIIGMTDNDDTPIFNGTCWPGATVNLTFSGDSNVYPALVQGDTWAYRRPKPFELDITHRLTVTQHAAGQDSPSAILPFSINRVLPTPVFTAPEVNEEVGCDLLVEGTDGVAGGRVQLWDAQFGGDLGSSDFLTKDGYWSVALKGLEFRDYRIQAVQVMGSRESLPSGVHVFKVVVLPPVIEVPAPQGAIARTAIISGTGLPFARVDVFLQGSPEPLLRDLLVNSEGRWRSEPVTLEIGHKTLWARQTFEARPSKDSAHQAFRVVPAAPSIETPVAVGQVGRQAVVSGFGYAGDEVAVAFSDEPQTVLGCVQVRHDRTWSVAVELDRLGGNYSLIAVQSRGEFHSSPSEARPVVLGTYMPSVDVPAPGRWVSDPVGFAGQGQTGKGILVSWYNPERVLAMDIVVTDEGWQRQARLNFSPGGHWVRFKQTIQRDVSWTESDWAESARFEVVSSQSEAKL